MTSRLDLDILTFKPMYVVIFHSNAPLDDCAPTFVPVARMAHFLDRSKGLG